MILLTFCLFLMFIGAIIVSGLLADNVDNVGGAIALIVCLGALFYGYANVIEWLIFTKEILK